MSARGARTGAGQGPGGRRGRLLGAAVPVAVICAAVVLGPRWNTDADDRAAASGASGASASPTSSAGPAATGTFTVARGGPDGSGGRGSKAYRVEVEDGSGVDPDGAAAEIAGILAAPRGWAHHGEHRFHRVSSGPAGLVIRIATPATTDAVCGKSGLDTHGEVNCRVGTDVMVNLKRWRQGSPEFHGPLAEYRALIVNHEVGHWLGHGHETCPGPGRPAPAMMQQIYGLKGCVANAWPYGADGRYLGGPAVP
ncbi:DUF3152 domain-containing protein [Streptomyces sp. NPDC015144]|uniref:DUF3152 domain-containing protein n=1 Tax=Streptomyces sp. NPDC015144 TaxID=3364944 RepID=UPI0036FACE1A